MNTFRLLGDLSHLLAIVILVHKLWTTKSCAGISGKSQILFAIVFTTRYLDLATTFISVYNTSMKIFFLTASYGTIYLIYMKLKKNYNDAHDSFGIEFLVLPAIALAVLINHAFDVLEVLWTFSIYLESVAILPQLYLICKTGESEATFYYLLTLFAYRALYEINWIYRYNVEYYYDEIAIVAGIVQTSLYILYFFYFYVIRANSRKDSVFHISVSEEWKTSDLVNKLNPHGNFTEKQPKATVTERIDVRTADLSLLQEKLMDGLDRDAAEGSCDKTDLEVNVVENKGNAEQTTGASKQQEQVIVRMERDD